MHLQNARIALRGTYASISAEHAIDSVLATCSCACKIRQQRQLKAACDHVVAIKFTAKTVAWWTKNRLVHDDNRGKLDMPSHSQHWRPSLYV